MPTKQKRVTIDSILGQPEPTVVSAQLVPAYGRDYQNAEECMDDWNEGLDFKIVGGPYCSIRDLAALKMMADNLKFYSLKGRFLQLVALV